MMDRRGKQSKPGGGGGHWKRRKENPFKSYKEKSDEKKLEFQRRREFGIKASYKKVLSKGNKNNFNRNKPSSAGEAQEHGKEGGVRVLPNVASTSADWAVASGSGAGPAREKQGNRNDNFGQKSSFSKQQYKSKPGNVKQKTWKGKNPSVLKKAQDQFQKQKEEKARKIEAAEKSRQERANAAIERKKKRLEKFKVLNQKTSKGQPVMKGRIQLLLNKIQANL